MTPGRSPLNDRARLIQPPSARGARDNSHPIKCRRLLLRSEQRSREVMKMASQWPVTGRTFIPLRETSQRALIHAPSGSGADSQGPSLNLSFSAITTTRRRSLRRSFPSYILFDSAAPLPVFLRTSCNIHRRHLHAPYSITRFGPGYSQWESVRHPLRAASCPPHSSDADTAWHIGRYGVVLDAGSSVCSQVVAV